MKKYNIVFDGNYLMHKTKSAFLSYQQARNITEAFDTSEKQAEFLRKIIIDMCHAINVFPDIKKVVIVFDGHSWRKDFYADYKKRGEGNPEDKEGWENLFKVMSRFEGLLTKKGFIVSKIDGFEGDDLLYFWSEHFKQQNEHTVIVSGDGDIHQLICDHVSVFDNNSKKKILYLENEISFMNLKKGIVPVEVDVKRFLFAKILTGDSGDNVPNVFKGMGEKTVAKITDAANSLGLLTCKFSNTEYIDKIVMLINTLGTKQIDTVLLKNNIQRNVKLMRLHRTVYSSEQLKYAYDHIYLFKDKYKYESDFNVGEILSK